MSDFIFKKLSCNTKLKLKIDFLKVIHIIRVHIIRFEVKAIVKVIRWELFHFVRLICLVFNM